jgi:hypothetical protein
MRMPTAAKFFTEGLEVDAKSTSGNQRWRGSCQGVVATHPTRTTAEKYSPLMPTLHIFNEIHGRNFNVKSQEF